MTPDGLFPTHGDVQLLWRSLPVIVAEVVTGRAARSSAGGGPNGGAFLERLRAHLHAATAQAGGAAGCSNPRYFDTEACAAAAAAMLLARRQGNLQVFLSFFPPGGGPSHVRIRVPPAWTAQHTCRVPECLIWFSDCIGSAAFHADLQVISAPVASHL